MKRIASALLAATLLTSTAQATTYAIDPTHTEVAFKVKHMGISNVRGQFLDFNGTIDFDPANIAASKTTASIKAKSIDTKNEKRDEHLRGDDFLNVSNNPTISFTSKEVKNVKGTMFDVVGELEINGVKKPVTLAVEHTGAVLDPWGSQRIGFHATTKINRKDFGLTWNKLLETGGLVVGEDVTIEITLEGIKETAKAE